MKAQLARMVISNPYGGFSVVYRVVREGTPLAPGEVVMAEKEPSDEPRLAELLRKQVAAADAARNVP